VTIRGTSDEVLCNSHNNSAVCYVTKPAPVGL